MTDAKKSEVLQGTLDLMSSTLDHVVGAALRFVFWKARTLTASIGSQRGRHEKPNQLPL